MTPPLDHPLLDELLGVPADGLSGRARRDLAQRLRAVVQAFGGDDDEKAAEALARILAVAEELSPVGEPDG